MTTLPSHVALAFLTPRTGSKDYRRQVYGEQSHRAKDISVGQRAASLTQRRIFRYGRYHCDPGCGPGIDDSGRRGKDPACFWGHPAISPMIRLQISQTGVPVGERVIMYQSRYFERVFPDDNAAFEHVE